MSLSISWIFWSWWALYVVVFFIEGGPIEWSQCAASDLIPRIEAEFQPPTPRRGKLVYFDIQAWLETNIGRGEFEVQYSVKLGMLTLIRRKSDLCEAIDFARKQIPEIPACPIQKGVIKIQGEYRVPFQVPMGRYSVHLSSPSLFCIDASVSI